jgi:glutamate-1-semialdehyde 2,1-aminomutase
LPVQVTGAGSILTMHFQTKPIRRPADTKETPAEVRGLFHLEMLRSGYYLARRGFISLSLPLVATDYDGFAAAFDGFLDEHRTLLSRELHCPGRSPPSSQDGYAAECSSGSTGVSCDFLK